MKMRTTIMLTSMVVLPMAAVLGLKWPEHLAADRPHAPSRPSTAHSRSAEPAPKWGAETGESALPPGPLGPQIATAKDINKPDNSDYLVIQASNIDVGAGRATVAEGFGPADDSLIRPLPVPNEEAPVAAPPSPTPGGDPFVQIQQRLRGMGATHYALETWGVHGEAYRFQCRMSAGHDPNYLRYFEATDVDPLRVMQTVLDDVEAWKSGRLP